MEIATILKTYNECHIIAGQHSPDKYAYVIDRLSLFFLNCPLGELEVRVQTYITERIAAGAAIGTVRREVCILITAINYCAKMKLISFADVPNIVLPPEPPSKDRYLKLEECDMLLTAANIEWRNIGGTYQEMAADHYTRAYLFTLIGLHTAARYQTIIDLTWSQVDLNAGVIHLNPEGRTQTKKRRPIVSISERLGIVLESLPDKTGAVLYNHGCLRKQFQDAVGRAKLENVTPHTLRHTYASLALQNGVDPYKVAGQMGDDLQTVLKRYGHHCPGYLKGAANFYS